MTHNDHGKVLSMNAGKVEDIRKYFEMQSAGFSVETNWDSDLRAWTFRFDNGARVEHLLKISGVILQDCMVAQIIKKLERAQWKAVLQQAKKNPVIFTSAGFESLTA
jgi:hypothetical protein